MLDFSDSRTELRRTSRVVPRRQLPPLVRPWSPGPLHYIETVCWRRLDDEIDIDVHPSLLGGRAQITARYRLTPAGTGVIRRVYEGAVSVDVALTAVDAPGRRLYPVLAGPDRPVCVSSGLNPGNSSGIISW